MYTILVTESNELITSIKECIMQRSKLVDNLHFLVDPLYKGHKMAEFTVMMEYITPVSRELKTELLDLSPELYKEKLEYKLPFDTDLTKEAGKIEAQLTFTKVELGAEGDSTQYVRKTTPVTITITPISAWADIVPDQALGALDQRLLKTEALIKELELMSQELSDTKADNIFYDEDGKFVQLMANGKPIGDRVEWVTSGGCGVADFVVNEDGYLIVSLSDGRVINAGHVVGKDGLNGVTFIPHISNDYILSWTNDGGLENPEPVDLYPDDEWSEVGSEGQVSAYKWTVL